MWQIYDIAIVVTCTPIGLLNGKTMYNKAVASNGRYPVDTRVSFTCNHGYRRTGPTSSTCQTSGNWIQQSPTCRQCNGTNRLFYLLFQHTQKYNFPIENLHN